MKFLIFRRPLNGKGRIISSFPSVPTPQVKQLSICNKLQIQSWGKKRRALEFCVEVYQCDSTYLSKVWKCPMNSLIATWNQCREYLTTSLQGDKPREKPRENSVIINTIKLINFKGKMWPQNRPFIPGLFSQCNNAQKMRACALESGFRIVQVLHKKSTSRGGDIAIHAWGPESEPPVSMQDNELVIPVPAGQS